LSPSGHSREVITLLQCQRLTQRLVRDVERCWTFSLNQTPSNDTISLTSRQASRALCHSAPSSRNSRLQNFVLKNLGSRYKNNLYKPEKTNVGFYSFFFKFLLCDLINEPHIHILIVICEIRQFIFSFHMVSFFAHWSKIRRTVYGMFFMCFWVVSCSIFVQK